MTMVVAKYWAVIQRQALHSACTEKRADTARRLSSKEEREFSTLIESDLAVYPS